jgi:two-component system, LytTR family, response regulator
MRWTVLVVDDEPLAREGLRDLLATDPDIAAIHEAADGHLAVEAIRTHRPDLVFLDVQMPERDGFGVIADVGPEHMPATVFVTAHDEHAIQAFEINAVDYLLKPVTAERFGQALARAKTRLAATPADDDRRQMVEMLATLVSPPRYVQRLAVKMSGRTVFVDIGDIDWIEAAENYVELHAGRASHLLHVPLSTLEKALDPAQFIRIHRSTIVRIPRIVELLPGVHGEFVVVLADGTRLDSGRTYSERLRALAANPF